MRKALLATLLTLAATVSGAQAPVTKASVPGVVNFSKVDTAVACAGATTPAALAEVKKMGYRSVINLRMPGEAGADLEAEAAAAQTAGINYIHLPFNGQAPDPGVVDSFLKVITDAANLPAFIHCSSGNRAGALWMIKRLVVDKWDVERASAEAAAIGMNPALKAFVIEQARKRGAPSTAADRPAPTFAADVAPTIYNNCSTCHRPRQAAPFSLLSYDDVKRRATLIASATGRRYMPPWHATPAPGFPA